MFKLHALWTSEYCNIKGEKRVNLEMEIAELEIITEHWPEHWLTILEKYASKNKDCGEVISYDNERQVLNQWILQIN